MNDHTSEVLVSVDVETSGPIPGAYSLLSIGACLVSDPATTFSCNLRPINNNAEPAALQVSGLSMDDLNEHGVPPAEAMARFAGWLKQVAGQGGEVVFVGFNAAFDWSFVNYYFHMFAGGNPFGFTALDIKAFYMGRTNCEWSATKSRRMADRLKPTSRGDHDALRDAQYQAELFCLAQSMPIAQGVGRGPDQGT